MLPGGVGIESATRNALDAVSYVPATRWDVDHVPLGCDQITAGRVRHGAFVHGAHLFDNQRFRIAPVEAVVMDPQQRLVLESGYAAAHSSGCTMGSLDGGMGVAVGICATEFAQLVAQGPHARSVYASQNSLSIASGRISYVLGLQGPCASYETACSAALVGCHAAVRALLLRLELQGSCSKRGSAQI